MFQQTKPKGFRQALIVANQRITADVALLYS